MVDGSERVRGGPDAHFLSSYFAVIIDADGGVISTQRLGAADDETAIDLAVTLAGGHAVEVWDGMRFIEHFDAKAV